MAGFVTISGDSHSGLGRVVGPSIGRRYNRLIIFLHGLGDTGENFSSLGEELLSMAAKNGDQWAQTTRIIFPTAPQKTITLFNGLPSTAWADLYGMDRSVPEDAVGFGASRERVQKIIEAELLDDENDITDISKQVIIGGFSLGGALSYHVATHSAMPFAGVMNFSTWLPFVDEVKQESFNLDHLSETPIIHVHGECDELVNHKFGQESVDVLNKRGLNIELFTCPKAGHLIDYSGVAYVKSFIDKIAHQASPPPTSEASTTAD